LAVVGYFTSGIFTLPNGLREGWSFARLLRFLEKGVLMIECNECLELMVATKQAIGKATDLRTAGEAAQRELIYKSC